MQMVGWLGDDQFDALDQTVKDKMAAAMAFANASPEPDAAEATTDVYAPSKTTAADVAAEAKLREQVRSAPDMRQITYAAALVEAAREEMTRDEQRLHHGRGRRPLRRRVRRHARPLARNSATGACWTRPISEATIGGAAVGAAMAGMRPIAEIMYVDFTPLAMDQIANQGAKNRYMFGGKTSVPMVIRTEGGAGRAIAAHHSQSLEALWTHFPGIYVVMPSTPYDAKGLLKAAIRDDNPVMFIEHKMLYGTKGPVPEEDYIIPLGVADIKRPGKDVTLVTYSRMVLRALEAAEILAKEGHRRRGDRPAHAQAAGHRHDHHLGQEDRPAGGRDRGVREHQLHQRGHGADQRPGLRLAGCADGARGRAERAGAARRGPRRSGDPQREPHRRRRAERWSS